MKIPFRVDYLFIYIYLEALIKQYITNIEQKNKKRDVFDKGLAVVRYGVS